jgi:hypothetical protein
MPFEKVGIICIQKNVESFIGILNLSDGLVLKLGYPHSFILRAVITHGFGVCTQETF